jgi:hypothetical protein
MTAFRPTYTIHGALFNEDDYAHAHGHSPHGRGNWAFCSVRPGTDGYLNHCCWFSRVTFAEARRRAAEHFAKLGVREIYVCG